MVEERIASAGNVLHVVVVVVVVVVPRQGEQEYRSGIVETVAKGDRSIGSWWETEDGSDSTRRVVGCGGADVIIIHSPRSTERVRHDHELAPTRPRPFGSNGSVGCTRAPRCRITAFQIPTINSCAW